MACAPSEDWDQFGHVPSLIRVFTVRLKKAWVLSYQVSTQGRLWSDWADAQADLNHRWAHRHFVGFDMRRLICPHNPDMSLMEKLYPVCSNCKYFDFLGAAAKFSETPTVLNYPPPLLGEHTDLVLGELVGYSGSRLQQLRKDGVIQWWGSITIKDLKIQTPKKIAVIILKLEQYHFTTE